MTPDYTNIEASKRKIEKYKHAARMYKFEFHPMSFEAFGRPSPASLNWISQIAKAIGNNQNRKSGTIKKDFLRKICFSIAKSNSLAIRSRQQIEI